MFYTVAKWCLQSWTQNPSVWQPASDVCGYLWFLMQVDTDFIELSLKLFSAVQNWQFWVDVGLALFTFSYIVYVEAHPCCFRPLPWFSESSLALLALTVFNCLEKSSGSLRSACWHALDSIRLVRWYYPLTAMLTALHEFVTQSNILRAENVRRWLRMAASPVRDLALDSRWNEQFRSGCGGLGTVAGVRHNPATAAQDHSCSACLRASWKVKWAVQGQVWRWWPDRHSPLTLSVVKIGGKFVSECPGEWICGLVHGKSFTLKYSL